MKPFWHKEPHQHSLGWVFAPEGAVWLLALTCDECHDVIWQASVRSREHLNDTLMSAFRGGELGPLTYYVAPTDIPLTPAIFEWSA